MRSRANIPLAPWSCLGKDTIHWQWEEKHRWEQMIPCVITPYHSVINCTLSFLNVYGFLFLLYFVVHTHIYLHTHTHIDVLESASASTAVIILCLSWFKVRSILYCCVSEIVSSSPELMPKVINKNESWAALGLHNCSSRLDRRSFSKAFLFLLYYLKLPLHTDSKQSMNCPHQNKPKKNLWKRRDDKKNTIQLLWVTLTKSLDHCFICQIQFFCFFGGMVSEASLERAGWG